MMQFEFGQLVTLKDENIVIGTMAEGKMIDKNVVFTRGYDNEILQAICKTAGGFLFITGECHPF